MEKKKVEGGSGITAGGNVSFEEITGQLAIGEVINQFRIEQPTGEALAKLVKTLDAKRKEEFNKKIIDGYSPSTLPNYPEKLKEFVTRNRAEDLTKALIHLKDQRVLLISGVGGVGKTTLARGLVDLRPANTPIPFWLDFAKNEDATLGDLLEKLAGYLKAPKLAQFRVERREPVQEDIDLLTDELQGRNECWLVFDNLETILDKIKHFEKDLDSLFLSLRESSHNAKIVVTSRFISILSNGESLLTIDEEKQPLKGLETPFAVEYLVKNGLDRALKNDLERLAEGVDGHPLALRLLVELVKKFGAKDTLDDLQMWRRKTKNTLKVTKKLFHKLAGEELELLRRLSVFRRPESLGAIEAMFTEDTSKDAVENLLDKSLLENDREGSYWLHPLVREFAYEELGDKAEAHRAAVRYYRGVPLPEKRSGKEDVQPLIEAHHQACKAEDYDMAASIIFSNNLHENLDRWGNYRILIELYSSLLPKDHLRGRPLLSSKQTHGAVLGNLGNAYASLGDARKAIGYYEEALKISREIGDRRGEGNHLHNLGSVLVAEKRFEDAVACLLLAKNIRGSVEDPRLAATESVLDDLKKQLGKERFERIMADVNPRAEEIVKKLLQEKNDP